MDNQKMFLSEKQMSLLFDMTDHCGVDLGSLDPKSARFSTHAIILCDYVNKVKERNDFYIFYSE